MVYVAQKYQLQKPLPYFLHQFRKLRYEESSSLQLSEKLSLGRKALLRLSEEALGQPVPADLQPDLDLPWPDFLRPSTVSAFRPAIRGVAEGMEEDKRLIWFREEDEPEALKAVCFDLPDRNQDFNPTILNLRDVFGFPTTLTLIDVEVDEEGALRPAGFVVEPDYLVDVTGVAECFSGRQVTPEKYLLNKWLPKLPSVHLLRGIAANYFLDEILGNGETTFRQAFARIFRLHPLGFALLSDKEVRGLQQKLQGHWVNLKAAIAQQFPEEGIRPDGSQLEPSFYSNRYGLQGRLDVFFRGSGSSAIVELKSGKPFMPNMYGVGANHFVQTLLYYLLIESAFGRQLDPKCYILYSSQSEKPLRYAPVIRARQLEALQARNQVLAFEWQMMRLKEGDLLKNTDRFFQRLRPDALPEVSGFARDDLERFRRTYDSLDPLERKYLGAFTAFIAREHQLAKIGPTAFAGINGQAAIWLNQQEEKEENYELLRGLKIVDNQAGEIDPFLFFQRTEATNPLANFRVGDLILLYPASASLEKVLQHQLHKGHIAEIDGERVVVRLRSRQFQADEFDQIGFWNLEHDQFDGNFTNQYRGLFAFAQQDPSKRQLLMARRPPQKPVGMGQEPDCAGMTDEQCQILNDMLAAEEYFLLWGPPGTGKTSIMLKRLAEHLMQHSDEHILLLAYTHRAVDEICDAIEKLPEPWSQNYLRIGSKYNTQPQYREKLLDVRMEDIRKRQDLVDLIQGSRIILATVASMAGKPELMQIKNFDRVIIDEASQILEPSLVGLLPNFPKFILIGDHKQLPAVVVQPPGESRVEDPDLNDLGLHDTRNSLFERLYLTCQEKGWDWAYGQLSHQGRMHFEIMAFPNRHFYNENLKVLPREVPVHVRQLAGLENGQVGQLHPGCGARVYFLETRSEEGSSLKTNSFEAVAVAELIRDFQSLYGDRLSLGVITPYRAQIAQIRKAMLEGGLDPNAYTVDTVERYQGGARDIILLSLCTNSPIQLASLVSLSTEGVDRKLNVAMTRAREHLVILGNSEVLKQDPLYRELIESYRG
jgi:DNA replication ATP-dependent helicase Dna2